MWLVFLLFPLTAILTDDSTGTGVKITSTVLFVAFAAVYLDGFRRQNMRAEQALLDPQNPGGIWHRSACPRR